MTYWQSIEDPNKRKRNTPQVSTSAASQLNSPTNVNITPQIPQEPQAPQPTPQPEVGDEVRVNEGRTLEGDRESGYTPSGPTTGDVGGEAWDGPPAEPEEQSIDEMAEEWNRAYLEQGVADTTDEEAYINQRISDQLGGDLVGQRARMGRAGFGSSGALAALESDAMRQANLDAEGRIYDVREREQDQTFEQGIGVQEIDIRQQEAAGQRARDEAIAEAITAMLGDPAAEPPPDDGPGAPNAGGVVGNDDGRTTAVEQAIGTIVNLPGNAWSSLDDAMNPFDQAGRWEQLLARDLDEGVNAGDPNGQENAQEVDSQPEGSVLVHSDGAYNYYTDDDGNWYKVRHRTVRDY